MNPKISIIVPVYKVEKYLEQCIQSILRQTFADFELILVDDGSPDRCGEICDNYAKQDKRIIVIHKKNGGLSSARNQGLEIAKGEYVGFVDSDDYLDADMYEILYNLAIRNAAQIAACRMKGIYADRIVVKSNTNEIKVFDNLAALEDLYFGGLLRVVVWNKLYQRKLLQRLRFKEGATNEDVSFTYLVLHQARRTVYIDSPLYNYRMSDNSITRRKFNPRMFDILQALRDQMMYFQKNNLTRYYEFVEYTYFTKVINLWYWSYKYIDTKKYDVQLALLNIEIRQNLKRIMANRHFKNKKLKYQLFIISPKLFFVLWGIYLTVTRRNEAQYL